MRSLEPKCPAEYRPDRRLSGQASHLQESITSLRMSRHRNRHSIVQTRHMKVTPTSARLPDLSSHQQKRSAETTESLLIRGMEFVLALEKPCLAHIEVDLTKSSEPSGHVLTATMPLLNACQYPHSFTDGGPSLEVSKSIFDRLTLLSPQLVDEEELSPIQLWNYIVDQQIAYRLDNNQLQILAQNLLQHIKCYGFGAVIEKGICMNMVSQMLIAN